MTTANESGLAGLVASPAGREWLRARGVHTDPAGFHAALAPPADARAAALAVGATGAAGDAPQRPLVYVGQQVAADFAPVTAAKFVAAADLARTAAADYVIAWHDMDRAGSDRYGLRIVLDLGGATTGVWLAHRNLADREPRFIEADPQRLTDLVRAAHDAAGALEPAARDRARQRIDVLADAVRGERPETVAQAARAFGSALLRERLAIELPWLYVSSLAGAGLLRDRIVDVLGAHEEVVAAYNASVQELCDADLDPHLKPLDERWLPLWWSCPQSGRRLRLVREPVGADVFAVARDCPCGEPHSFHLGGARPSLADLEASGRWSPDVLLPVLTDHLFSGYVAGRSSAAYGIVMRDVLERALGRAATPAFLPAEASDSQGESSTILHAHLLA